MPWGDIRDLKETFWHLYLLHWDADSGLLFINSSDNSSVHEDLATVVAGDTARLIRGETIFRSMHGLNRFVIMSLGLRHLLNRNIQFPCTTVPTWARPSPRPCGEQGQIESVWQGLRAW